MEVLRFLRIRHEAPPSNNPAMRVYFQILFSAVLVIRCLEGLSSGAPTPSRPTPYQVVYTNGQTIEGAAIGQDHFLAHGRSNAHLDEQPIFAPGKHVRLIRNRKRRVRREGPYLELVNGDLLPGETEGIEAANPGRNIPAHLRVRLTGPIKNYAGQVNPVIRVRADHVARIITDRAEAEGTASGYLRLKSGTTVEFSSIRWGHNKAQALTARGVQTILMDDVVTLQQPIVERIRWMQTRMTELFVDPSGHRVTMHVVDGSRLTTPERKMLRHTGSSVVIQPCWSLDALVLEPKYLAEIRYLRPNEIPLAALPAENVVKKSPFGKSKWTRYRNVRGGRLHTSDRDDLIGVGMHADSAVVFHLPPGAESFSSWVGIDRSVGGGGCAAASVFFNDLSGKPVWKSGYLQGGKSSVRIGPLSVKGQERLILVADSAHQGRPKGADPFDIRDEVDWISSVIQIKPTESSRPDLNETFAYLKGWTLSDEDRRRLSVSQILNVVDGRWIHTLKFPTLPVPKDAKNKPGMLLGKSGVHYEVFANHRGRVLPKFDQLEPNARGIHSTINLNARNVPKGQMALRFRTMLVVPRDGSYEFYLTSDDGTKLYVDGRLLIDNDHAHPAIMKQGRVSLKKGGVPFEVEYFDFGKERALLLEWMGPDIERQPIPRKAYDLARIPHWGGTNGRVNYTPLEPVTLSRSVRVGSPYACLCMAVGKGNDGIGDYEIDVQVDGKPVRETLGRDLRTRFKTRVVPSGGLWPLGQHVGKTVNLQVTIKPMGYPGYEIPSLNIDQLEIGPEPSGSAVRAIAQDLPGRWQLRGAQSIINKSYHTGRLSGCDGSLELASDGTARMQFRLPTGERRVGAGRLVLDDGQLALEYANWNWVKDHVKLSDDRKNMTVQEQGANESWSLVFTREDLSPFAKYVGRWRLRGGQSHVENHMNKGSFAGGGGHLVIGPDGGLRISLHYPRKKKGYVHREATTGKIVFEDGKTILKFDARNWSDDRIEWRPETKTLVLLGIKHEDKWKLVFTK
jgi:hypothetical protein